MVCGPWFPSAARAPLLSIPSRAPVTIPPPLPRPSSPRRARPSICCICATHCHTCHCCPQERPPPSIPSLPSGLAVADVGHDTSYITRGGSVSAASFDPPRPLAILCFDVGYLPTAAHPHREFNRALSSAFSKGALRLAFGRPFTLSHKGDLGWAALRGVLGNRFGCVAAAVRLPPRGYHATSGPRRYAGSQLRPHHPLQMAGQGSRRGGRPHRPQHRQHRLTLPALRIPPVLL